ncbi:uncharacterized protein LOC108864131 [Galendromus occidentalis]|uniref:Uncharacterized protein LOC108864131 n=1 Tax=Galendromus occidentalis TaxID=34638 RepID=A0AAJ7P9H0_9ACAR|nr:uncharacterized protein LOC108864131 [Galendromus occidentalis]
MSNGFNDAQIDQLQKMFSKMESKIEARLDKVITDRLSECMDLKLKPVIKKVELLSKDTAELKSRLLQAELSARRNNTEIVGFPVEHASEPGIVLMNMAKKIGLTIQKTDLITVYKTGKPRRLGERDCQNIIAEWSNHSLASSFILKVNEYRKRHNNRLDARMFFNSETSASVAVYPHLPREMKQLRWIAKKKAEELGYNYCWITPPGKLLMRKSEGSPSFWIRCEEDLIKLK